jgi:hypothetical protein
MLNNAGASSTPSRTIHGNLNIFIATASITLHYQHSDAAEPVADFAPVDFTVKLVQNASSDCAPPATGVAVRV